MLLSARYQVPPMFVVLMSCFLPLAQAGDANKPRLISKSLYLASPANDQSVWPYHFYTRSQGSEMMGIMSLEVGGSDIYTGWLRRFSSDNGRTWSAWEPHPGALRQQTSQGVHVIHPMPGWVDPGTGRMLEFALDGVLPTGSPIEGMRYWGIRYRVSTDGGRTYAVNEKVIQKGNDPYGNPYSESHPVDTVWIGKNAIMIGAVTCVPIRTRQNKILLPVMMTPLDSYNPPGNLYNPTGGYTYTDAGVLIGTWQDNMTIDWQISQRVVPDPNRSTRGMDEPTIAQMSDDRILMVMRGSNAGQPNLPGYKWYSVSNDGGMHWTTPEPWKYSDGSSFYSPASCSQLLTVSSGKTYWIGNIVPSNPSGNNPRYPLVIGEVDPASLMLIKDSVTTIDTLGPGDNSSLQLSNFYAYEDRETHNINILCTRYYNNGSHWVGDSYLYQVAIPEPSTKAMLLSIGGALLAQRWLLSGSKKATDAKQSMAE